MVTACSLFNKFLLSVPSQVQGQQGTLVRLPARGIKPATKAGLLFKLAQAPRLCVQMQMQAVDVGKQA